MRFALMIEPQQGLSYGDQLAIAKRAEADGFETFFRSDHYRASRAGRASRRPTPGRSSPASPARPTGSGSACSSRRSRSAIPGNFAKVVTTVDEMSGGRIEVGVGAGWNDAGAPPARACRSRRSRERADLLEDQLAILHGLWGEPDGWSYRRPPGLDRGRAASSPKPVDVPGRPRTPIGGARPRILVGGAGIAAVVSGSPPATPTSSTCRRSAPDQAARGYAALDAACGRSAATRRRSTRSAMAGVLVGRDEAEVRERVSGAARGVRHATPSDEAWLEPSDATRWVIGTPDEARDDGRAVRRRPGVERIMLQDFLPLGPRHDRRHGRGARSAGLTPPAAASCLARAQPLGSLGGGRAVDRVVAADRVGVGAAGAGEALGQQLERRRRAEQGGHRRRAGPASSATSRRPGRRQRRGRSPRRGPRPGSPRRGCRSPARPRAPGARARPRSGRPARSVEDQDEPGLGAGRRQVAVEERLEVAVGRREPGRLLDLERQLAAGRPVRAGGDHQQVRARSASAAAIRSAPASSRAPAASRPGDRVGVEGPAGELAPRPRRRRASG